MWSSEDRRITESSKSSTSFMFSEEQITKQLVDMKEQTDFMKRFRCALGIALREIKTLRTATENENDPENISEKNKDFTSTVISSNFHRSHSSPNSHGSEVVKSTSNVDSNQRDCGEFASTDLRILKEYLNKMEIGDHSKNVSVTSQKPFSNIANMEKMRHNSRTLIERSIDHIERLKGSVESKNALIKKLCQQLSQTRSIRVKRESKLEEKLLELSQLKEKYTKIRSSYEKQVIISRSLRAALNSQRLKTQSAENMGKRMEDTHKAFNSLKLQAGHLMNSLREKDYEIAELTAQLTELEKVNTENSLQDYTQTGKESDACANCERKLKDIESLKMNYHRLYDDFEYYRRNHRPSFTPESTQPPRDYDQNHPYGRRRMHAPYTSPQSYRRVSRPPLRRRLNYGSHSSGNDGIRTNASNAGDTLLSPIDEYVENVYETSQDATGNTNAQIAVPSANPTYARSNFHDTKNETSRSIGALASSVQHEPASFRSGDINHCDPTVSMNSVMLHDARKRLDIVRPQNKSQDNEKTSYLELGNSASPSPSTSSNSGFEAEPNLPLRMNSFIRRDESDGFDSKKYSQPNENPDITNLDNFDTVPEPFRQSFGVVWHPALKESGDGMRSLSQSSSNEEIRLEKLDVAQTPMRLQLFGCNQEGDPSCDDETAKNQPHCVSYKGHKIDVTDFSINAFRDILWSLDGGPESADAFIKFLASTAKKLNASPKWAGKHKMGDPNDWLALRGLY